MSVMDPSDCREERKTDLSYLFVKQKRKPRRFYCYNIGKRNAIVLSARSITSATNAIQMMARVGINGEWPKMGGVEHTADRVRTVYKGWSGRRMKTAYGIFMIKNTSLNRRIVKLDIPQT